MAVTVYETDIGVYLNKKGGFDNLKFKAGEVPLSIILEDVSSVKGGNALLVQQAADKCWPLVKKELPRLITALQAADREKDEKKQEKAAFKEINDFCDEIYDDIVKMASSVFESFAKEKKAYSKYKWKSGLKIGVSGVSLAGSIALTAASGWSGVGTVVGVVGMVRSSASLVQQIVNLTKDSEDIYDRIVANVLKLRKQLASPSVKEHTAKQVAATVMNKVFAVEIESIVVTVEGIEGDFALMLNKVRGNKVNAASLAGDIPKLLKRQDEVEKEVDELNAIGVRTKLQQSELAKLEAKQKKLWKELDTTLKEITGLADTIDKLEKWAVLYHKEIETINSKYSAKAVKAVGIATELVVAAGSFVGGDFSSPAGTLKDLHTAGKAIVAGMSIAQDGLGTIVDSGTSIYQAIKKG